MVYEIIISEKAEKDADKMDSEMYRRFVKKIEKLKENPEVGKPLSHSFAGLWELYFEKSFRIIYSIDKKNLKVYIIAILHKNDFRRF